MTQVLGNGATQNYGSANNGSPAPANSASVATQALFDMTHYTWNDALCPSATGTAAPSWCSTNLTWANALVIEVRRTNWAGAVNAPWEWTPGSGSGHGPGNAFANLTSQNAGPGCGSGILNDSGSCNLNSAISTGGSPTMPTNYYTLGLSYSTGAAP
jgi:hypothetical protein